MGKSAMLCENLPGYDLLAGVYVAYLGVSLCQNVINGAEGSSPGFMVGVIFIVFMWLCDQWNPWHKGCKIQKEPNAESEAQALR